ncbi:MAG: hypothetical protein H6719_04710 [Sandaracinaceae bacterium]|nr:hypothetical protein [Sandaracinaceae bacterium]
MIASLTRAATFGIALLASRGCIGPDGQQLMGEDTPWEECSDRLLAEGQNGDLCSFEEGSGCGTLGVLDVGQERVANTCVDHRLIRSHSTMLSLDVPEDRCVAPNVLDYGQPIEVRPSTDGCLEVARCDPMDRDGFHVLCQDPGPEGLREDAAEVEPWTDCDAALQDAADHDPCVGTFVCGGPRFLGPGHSTGQLAAWCDQGVLRLFTLDLIVHR